MQKSHSTKTFKASKDNVSCDNDNQANQDTSGQSNNCFMFYSKMPKSESINRLQLSILNTGLFPVNCESENITELIAQNGMELWKFRKYVQKLRKYDVLAKIEFEVSSLFS